LEVEKGAKDKNRGATNKNYDNQDTIELHPVQYVTALKPGKDNYLPN